MNIDDTQIEKLSELAKIELSPEEKKAIPGKISAVLKFVEQLNTLDTDGVEETSQVTGLTNVVRADEDTYTFEKDDMIASMPKTDENGSLVVHAVFSGDSPSN